MKQRKRGLLLYSFYDHAGIVRHLEEMAREGWLLEAAGSVFRTYRRSEPAELRYAVVYFPKASQFDPEPLAEQKDFGKLCRSTGWELVASRYQMQIFRDPAADPVAEYSCFYESGGTPLLWKREGEQSVASAFDPQAPELTYTVWQPLPPLYSAVKDSFFQDLRRGRYLIAQSWQAVDAVPWGAEEAYQFLNYDGTPDDSYLLCYADRLAVVRLRDWDAAPTAVQLAHIGQILSRS